MVDAILLLILLANIVCVASLRKEIKNEEELPYFSKAGWLFITSIFGVVALILFEITKNEER